MTDLATRLETAEQGSREPFTDWFNRAKAKAGNKDWLRAMEEIERLSKSNCLLNAGIARIALARGKLKSNQYYMTKYEMIALSAALVRAAEAMKEAAPDGVRSQ